MAQRERIDRVLVARGLAPTQARAQALVVAGKVVVAGHRVDKPGTLVAIDAEVIVRTAEHPYVSRGGVKLAGALACFAALPEPLEVAGKIAIDIGASTGGFTDCLLQHGALRVHAVDVGYGQLAWSLVSDARVRVHDRCNVRTLAAATIGEPAQLAVIDCSFIALAKVLPHVPRLLAADADVIALVKPQFELEAARVGEGGIVRADEDRREALARAALVAAACGLRQLGSCDSPIAGSEGNRELFLWLRWTAEVPARAPDS